LAVSINGSGSGDDAAALDVLHGGGAHVEAGGGAHDCGGEARLSDGLHQTWLGHEHCPGLHVVLEVGPHNSPHDLARYLNERCLHVFLGPGLNLGLYNS